MSPVVRDRLIFTTRTTLAAGLAAFVAFVVELPQASSSIMTVFIVSQPLTGMVLSKALYRTVGTIVGGVVAVAITATLYDARELFVVAVSLWIAGCVFVSIYLRDAPASYGALLSGYTVAIIAFPVVDAPDTVFLAALDRIAEIFVGLASATVLSQVFFPRSAGRALKASAETALASASRWAADTLRGRPDPAAVLRDRRALVANVATLDGLRIHASFDSATVRLSNRRIRLLHGRLISFLALVVAIHDRMEILRAERPDRFATLAPTLAGAADAMAAGAPAGARTAAAKAVLAAAPDFAAMRASAGAVLERTILVRVADLLALRDDLDGLSDLRAPETDRAAGEAPATLERYRDYQLAFTAAAAAFVALVGTFAFWILSGWVSGAGAVIFVAVMASLFAQADDPAAAAGGFTLMTAVGAVVAGVYLFGVLPRLEGFEALALALAPLVFGAAYAMSIPAYTLRALALGLGAINIISLSNVMTYDFAAYANTTVASLFGLGLAAALLRVLRPIGTAWPVARLVAGLRRDLAEAAASREAPTRTGFESRMFDRINGLMIRLDLRDPRQLALEQGALAALRVGLNTLALRRVVRALPSAVGAPLADALAELARHFRRLARREPSVPPLDRLDAALSAALAQGPADEAEAAELAVWIAALRSSLAQHPALFGVARRVGEAAA
ncbi:FUSC family protein [Methylopila sp. Yamaguchi]|uniref:FUSC family protein n=1 Tax=Methylopila sp. Yamaguchi TaxID=1437817 RepID=UPI000CA999A9|nr:FUSC family protein [Methylopila sp. Yamaguchi]GBD47743.1 fusaric acid resistance protein conserved region [Methylopila sp. Yamaguchi]